ncbi:Inner membrane amino-acid ABC transporter permease protein yecS [Raoultella terrigena]|uniref:Inner membrane amino-acid ABC transporter permease protein yecS n=1 Tax=Raoultella terrigena TaxID=577 RepID=A0A3P8KZT3_RAOTE|nr:Inner membrane amino-acid ABC transporter permease protein yecS [Raoultella terrigena]
MQLFLAFFGVALFGIDVSPWTAASMALTFYTSAFLLDIWFGSIRALPKGQWEASRCLGPELHPDAVPGRCAAGAAHRPLPRRWASRCRW